MHLAITSNSHLGRLSNDITAVAKSGAAVKRLDSNWAQIELVQFDNKVVRNISDAKSNLPMRSMSCTRLSRTFTSLRLGAILYPPSTTFLQAECSVLWLSKDIFWKERVSLVHILSIVAWKPLLLELLVPE